MKQREGSRGVGMKEAVAGCFFVLFGETTLLPSKAGPPGSFFFFFFLILTLLALTPHPLEKKRERSEETWKETCKVKKKKISRRTR